MISCNLIILHFLKNPIFLSRKKNSITWRHQRMCAIFGGVALRICCVDSLPCAGIVLLILLANSTSNTIFLRKIVKGLRVTCCFKQTEHVLQIDRFGHFPSKSELLILAECLPLCIYEVGWVHCALASRNKSPPCEVSDRLLGTLEKVQNNIGGNTGQSSSPRLWNTLINANKGWTWMICGTRLPPKHHKMAIRQWPWNSGFFWGIAQEIYAFKHSLWILWFWWLWAHGRGGLGDVWEGSAVGVEEEI